MRPRGLAVLVPARDEEAALPGLLRRLDEARPSALRRVVVVDNGSRDATSRVAREAGAEVVREPRPGYGSACQAGLRALDTAPDGPPEVVVFLDADDHLAAGQVDAVAGPVLGGRAELVIGERRAVDGRGVRGHAALGNRLVTGVLRGLYGSAVRDMGPFRAARWSTLRALGLDDPDYGWYVQMQVRALKLGARVGSVPVAFERRTVGRSKVSGSVWGSLAAGRVMLRTLAVEALRAPPDRCPYGKPQSRAERRSWRSMA